MTQNRWWWTLAAVFPASVMGWGVWASSQGPAQTAAFLPVTPTSAYSGLTNAPAIPPVAPPPKQHFRFTFEIEYKGDGIEADVAKTALGGKSSSKQVDLGEITQLLEKLIGVKTGKKVKTTASEPVCAPSPCAVPVCPAAMPEESKKPDKPAKTAEASEDTECGWDHY